MTKFYVLEPEVSGGWGEHTVSAREPGQHPRVHRLHYKFDGWLGDELLETTPCYIVTERLADDIRRAGLTGAAFDEVEVSTSEQFEDLHPDRKLPAFVWLKVNGAPAADDFGVTPDLMLVVSERALKLLRNAVSHRATIRPYQP
jgi:hypothetical protein